MKKIYSARQIHEDHKIYWVKSYKTILKYMNDYEHILKPITTGSKPSSGKRYYVSEENLKEFVKMFKKNKLT